MLAANLGLPFSEIEPLLTSRHMIAEIDRSETWWMIAERVDQRLGELMAVKLELSKALQRDRRKRVMRIERLRRRSKRASPRS